MAQKLAGLNKLTLLVILALATTAHAAMAKASSTVMVQVREQQALVQSGSDMLLKVRLSPGVSARVWFDVKCDSPNESALTVTQSGSYVLPIAGIPSIQGRANLYSCMVSSDGQLSAAVPMQ